MMTSIYAKKMTKALLAGGFIIFNMAFLPSLMAKPKTNPVAESKCGVYVQTKVAWNNNNKNGGSWPRKYVVLLCKGVSVATHKEPGICHARVQKGYAWNHRNATKQKYWGSTQVAGLCAGASDGVGRANCFESKAATDGWAKAMQFCKTLN